MALTTHMSTPSRRLAMCGSRRLHVHCGLVVQYSGFTYMRPFPLNTTSPSYSRYSVIVMVDDLRWFLSMYFLYCCLVGLPFRVVTGIAERSQ